VTPRRVTFFSEGLSGRETSATVNEAFEGMGMKGKRRMTLKHDATDETEKLWYNRVNGLDNPYSNTNTVVRRREFGEYRPTHSEVFEGPQYLIADHWERPRKRWE
jgi:hypothetical protein